MAKKPSKKYGPQQVPTVATPNAVVQRPLVEKQLLVWTASFDNASKVYQSFDMSLDIEVDQNWLRNMCERFQAEGSVEFSRWIDRFAEVCRELGKLKEKLHDEYSSRWDEANKLGLESEEKDKAIAEQLAELETARRAFENSKAELEHEQVQLALKKSEILDIERSLRLREANANAGFSAQNEAALRQLEEQQRQQTKQHEAYLEEVREEKRKLGIELSQSARQLAEIKYSCTEEENERTRQLDQREHDLKQNKMELDRARSRLDREWSDINAAEASLEQRIATEMEVERANHAKELARVELQRDKAWKMAEQLKEQSVDTLEFKQALGEQSTSEFLEQLETLRAENRDLRRTLDQSDTADLQRENEYLRNSKADLERDISTIQPELDNVRRELSTKRVAATDLEQTAKESRLLKYHNNLLSAQIDELGGKIEHLTNAQKTKTPFREMSRMDSEKEFRASTELESVPNLKQFAEELQHRIARAEKHVELYYPLKDIRVLLGGLAMSQLHVFQGISGTGKTSLAKAFAKAMGGFCTDIAVQAGWRDRDDLLGHFNSFEQRFYEKDCLQALYKAQTPRWQDTCNVILLDEMNLSRPEQYFAEFLSALEKNDRDERVISLFEGALPNAPAMLRDGCKILVPENVWFIGTANHDETTNDLADKTYDRAHVMTLPKQDHRFTPKTLEQASYSYRSLRKAFALAQAEHKGEVQDLLDLLSRDVFTEQLGSQFKIGWGNRFEKHALDFIPVMLATGASSGDALDHLLSTRYMRSGKVTGRYDVRVDAVRGLKDTLETFWIKADLDGEPEKSFELLDADIRRLEVRS